MSTLTGHYRMPFSRLPVFQGSLILALCSCFAIAVVSAKVQGTDAVNEPEINIWVDEAPLETVVQQLAQLSGTKAKVEGTLDAFVTGRFIGSLDAVLSALSAEHDVLFDVADGTLHATGSEKVASVSIAIAQSTVDESLQQALLGNIADGNKVELREDAVRVSGHPEFVKRTVNNIAQTLAVAELKNNSGTLLENNAPSGGIASEPAENAAVISDSGSNELLLDIENEQQTPAVQTKVRKPIEWVTDIPGFDTF